MKHVQAFIANYSVPQTLDELLLHWKEDQTADLFEQMYVLNAIGIDYLDQYTGPRWAKVGDVVFLMESKSSRPDIGRMTKEFYDYGSDMYNYRDFKMIMEALTHAKETYERIGGTIYGLARIATPAQSFAITDDDRRYNHWTSTVYVDFEDIFLLENPVPLESFKDVVKLSSQSSITPVFGEAFDRLKSIIAANNRVVPRWFLESDSVPVPLTKLNRENFLEVSGKYRRNFFLECQFRSYYVDYLLPLLGDIKKIYKECKCIKIGANPTWVDNAVRFNRRYLPVEIKLNILLEQNLPKQLQQYMNVDQVYLTDQDAIPGDTLLPFVMVVDVEGVYLFDGQSIQPIEKLDDLNTMDDVAKLKEKLHQIID